MTTYKEVIRKTDEVVRIICFWFMIKKKNVIKENDMRIVVEKTEIEIIDCKNR